MSKKITITLSKELHERLQEVRSEFNVSRVCAQGIANEVLLQEVSQTPCTTMDEIIARLKIEKDIHEQSYVNAGRLDGITKAETFSYGTLVIFDKIYRDVFKEVITSSRMLMSKELMDKDLYKIENDRPSYCFGFLMGVHDFWERVKDKI